jgi:hypothetical protein
MADSQPGSNPIDDDYNADHSITVKFSLYFSLAKCIAWWGLWLVACTYALLRRKVVSRAWFIYTALLIVICCDGIECSASLGWATHANKGHKGIVAWLLYLFFFNISRSMFLVRQTLGACEWRASKTGETGSCTRRGVAIQLAALMPSVRTHCINK